MAITPSTSETPVASTPDAALFAQVLMDVPVKTLSDRLFTYGIPEALLDNLKVGHQVLVPFSGRLLNGFVVGFSTSIDFPAHKLKPIDSILDSKPLCNAFYFEFLEWISNYYTCPLLEVLQCAIPTHLTQDFHLVYALADNPPDGLQRLKLSPIQETLLSLVETHDLDGDGLSEASLFKLLTSQLPQQTSHSHQSHQSKTKSDKKSLTQTLATLKSLGWLQTRFCPKHQIKAKTIRCWSVVQLDAENLPKLNEKQQQILEFLSLHPDTPENQLTEKLSISSGSLKTLEKKQLLICTQKVIHRSGSDGYQNSASQTLSTLTPAQQTITQTILKAADNDTEPYLIHGVTGSGKTEVYLTLAQDILKQGKSVLLLLPEIALTSQIAQRFIAHFGKENIALWHSHLSAGEKVDTWHRLASGDLRILIGARSAIWGPIQNLGLIVIDEEHDAGFKQDSPAPRYNAKTLAEELGKRHGAQLVLGSATPEITSYYRASETQHLLNLTERFSDHGLAPVQIVDMKQERIAGVKGHLSRALLDELKKNLEAQEQSVIVINRRGFFTSVQCTHCDYIFTCPDCDVSLTLHHPKHLAQPLVRCHYCAYEAQVPAFCPQCASMTIQQTGVGTQRIESDLLAAFPEVKILRLDTDTARGKDAPRQIIDAFARGEADILLGTQMVAKGLNIPNVTLVGVIAADSCFSLPEFKSAERGFQLLTQAAGRAGRADKPGRVIIQAVHTEHPVIHYATHQDYPGFYQHELIQRQILQFPPFSQLIRFIISGESEKATLQFAQAVTQHLQQQVQTQQYQNQLFVTGPASCIIPRIQGRYRFHILVKNQLGATGHSLISTFFQSIQPPEGIHFLIDIDALSLM